MKPGCLPAAMSNGVAVDTTLPHISALSELVITDDDLKSEGYRTSPYDDDGTYIGAPLVSSPSRRRDRDSFSRGWFLFIFFRRDVSAFPARGLFLPRPAGLAESTHRRIFFVSPPSPLTPPTFTHFPRRVRSPVQPPDDKDRVAKLRSMLLLDSVANATLDGITTTCTEVFQIPVCLISLVDRDRQWFKSRANFSATQTGRRESFCGWTLLLRKPKVLLVNDAEKDPRFKRNPLVTGGPLIRFYAGTPLIVNGIKLGTLCLIDYKARPEFGAEQIRMLNSFGNLVGKELARPPHTMWMIEAMDTVKEGVMMLDFETHHLDVKPEEAGKKGTIEDTMGVVIFMNKAMTGMVGPRKDNLGKSLVQVLDGATPESMVKLKAAQHLLEGHARRRMFRNDVHHDDDDDGDVMSAMETSESDRTSFDNGCQGTPFMQGVNASSANLDAGCDINMEIEVKMGHELRRLTISMDIVSVEKTVFNHMVVLVTVRDITEEYEANRLLKETKEQAEAAVRAKSAFLANTSHEIRTPLNAMIAGSELLSEIPGMTLEQQEVNEMVLRASHTLLGVVSDVLDFSKMEAEKLYLDHRPFHLESCIDLALEMQSIKANKKNLTLAYFIAKNTPRHLLGDEMRLRQVLTNLISNAVKFTQKGSVEIEVRALNPDEDELDVLENPVSREKTLDIKAIDELVGSGGEPQKKGTVKLLFEVLDTGVGIEKQYHATLFNAFEQVNSQRTRNEGGTGLGLAISSKLSQLMGGKMVVTSEGKDCGSRFAFTVSLDVEEDSSDKIPLCVAGPLLGRKLLIVSSCEPFIKTAISLASTVGFQPVVLDAAQSRSLLSGQEWGTAAVIMIDREFIPKDAVKNLADASAKEVVDNHHDASSKLGLSHSNSTKETTDGRENYGESCNEYINIINSKVIQQSKEQGQPPPPAVMVLTVMSPCVLSERVSVCVKPLIMHNFVKWVRELVDKFAESGVLSEVSEKAVAGQGGTVVQRNSPLQPFGLRRQTSFVKPKDDRGTRSSNCTVYEFEADAKARVRILIAEDNVMNQKVLTRTLHAIGFRSTVAKDGKEAVEKYREACEAGEPFDLILMDLQMPVMDGLMATRAIFEYTAGKDGVNPLIVALTADVAQSVVEECRDCKMHGFMSKPIKRDTLEYFMTEVATWVGEGRDPHLGMTLTSSTWFHCKVPSMPYSSYHRDGSSDL